MVHRRLLAPHHNIHQAVDRALPVPPLLHRSIQHRYPQRHPESFLAGLLERAQHRPFPVQLRLPVQVRRPRRGVGLVRRLAGPAGKHVVGRDVDEQDVARGAQPRECPRGLDVEDARARGVLVDLVWEAVCGAWGKTERYLLGRSRIGEGRNNNGVRLTVDDYLRSGHGHEVVSELRGLISRGESVSSKGGWVCTFARPGPSRPRRRWRGRL